MDGIVLTQNAYSTQKLILCTIVVLVLFVTSIAATVFITQASITNEASCSVDSETPKNLIIVIGD